MTRHWNVNDQIDTTERLRTKLKYGVVYLILYHHYEREREREREQLLR